MILTDRFVYVHQPKTGGSFVTSALYRVHEVGVQGLPAQRLRNKVRLDKSLEGKYGLFRETRNKHGLCRRIPKSHADKPILASVRNPFDRYVSEYEFEWWKKKSLYDYFSDAPDFNRRYPNFPKLTFEEYVQLVNDIPRGYFCSPWASDYGIGRQSREFLMYYSTNAPVAFERLIVGGEDPCKLPDELMHPVRFMLTHRLNADLHAALSDLGYDAEDIAFIREMKRVLPGGKGRTKAQKWQAYYTPELMEKVRQKEAVLLRLFPEFDPGPA